MCDGIPDPNSHQPWLLKRIMLQVCDDGILEADYTEDDISKVVCAQLGFRVSSHQPAPCPFPIVAPSLPPTQPPLWLWLWLWLWLSVALVPTCCMHKRRYM